MTDPGAMAPLAPLEGCRIRIDPSGASTPAACACCGALPSGSRLARRGDGGSLIVPYCEACLGHALHERTSGLAALLSASLMGATCAAVLPGYAAVPSALVVVLSLGAAMVPLLVASLWPRARASGHACTGRAVWWERDGRVACASASWALELARMHGAQAEPALLRERRLPAWALAGLLVPSVLVGPSLSLQRPTVRIVNLGDTRLEVRADSRRVAVVEPTSSETPAAVAIAWLPAGHRRLTAHGSDGDEIDAREVVVEAGAQHLYAPRSEGWCFWLETTGYGRSGEPPRIEPLEAARHFWVLREPVDRWFVPSPPASDDLRSSGGRLTAARLADCREAPPPVRRVVNYPK